MTEQYKNKFEQVRLELRLTNREFAAKIGINETNYSKLKKDALSLGDQTKNKIKDAFPEYNLEWLLYGKGDRLKLPTKFKPFEKIKSTPEGNAVLIPAKKEEYHSVLEYDNEFIDIGNGQFIMIVPLIEEYAYAGYLSGFSDEEYVSELPKHSIIVNQLHRGKYFSFRVLGDSMDDGTKDAISDGDIVTGREIQKALWNSRFHIHRFKDYIIVHKEGILIKRILTHDVENGIITCQSLNPNKDTYPDFELFLDDISQIMNIINVTRPR